MPIATHPLDGPTHTARSRAARPVRALGRALPLLLGLSLAAVPAAAQAEEARPSQRSPLIAVVLAANAPGAGHFYAGETTEGLVIASAVMGGFVLFLSGWAGTDDCFRPTCDPTRAERRRDVGTGIMLGSYAFSLIDAPRAVLRRNRRSTSLPEATASANLIVGSGGRPGLEIRIPVGR
jgi:hypothetical protein